MTRYGWRRWWLPAWSGLLTLLVWAPLAGPGFVMSYDMVTVPRQSLVPESLGLGGGLPRAVPQDAVLAIVTSVVPGELVYRAVLVGVVFFAALGAGRLLDGAGLGAQTAAATAYAWNAYVAERLVIGHWTLLVAYSALPWIVRAGVAARNGDPRALPRVALLIAISSLTPTGGLLAVGLAAVVFRGRTRWFTVAIGLVLQLPWLAPALLNSAALSPDPAGAWAFAARSDSPLGLVGSVLTLGGIWNGDVVPVSRGLVSAAVLTVAWVGLGALGVRDLGRRLGIAGPLALVAAAGIVLALAGTWGDGLAWTVEHIPGAGLMRDGQKFLAWSAVALAPAVGLGARRVGLTVARATRRAVPAALPMLAIAVIPVLALPDLAWGGWGRLEPVRYPADWNEARDVIRQHRDGALIVLPFQPFRAYPWNDHRTALDPFPRFAGVESVLPDALTVGTRRVAGEDPRAAEVYKALQSDRALEGLRHAGVALIAVQRDTPGQIPADLTADLEPLFTSTTIDVYRVPGYVGEWPSGAPAVAIVTIDLVVLLMVATTGVWLFLARVRVGRTPGPGTVTAG